MENIIIKLFLGNLSEDINNLKLKIEVIENLILHKESKLNGFATLKKHLQRPDKPLPLFCGRPIEQD